MDKFTYFFSKSEDTLEGVAARYKTTDERIRDLSKAENKKWADHWLITIEHTSVLQDNDEMVVPIPEPLPSLPAGAEWKEYMTPEGATVASVIETLKQPNDLGRIIGDDSSAVAQMIWDHYINAGVRRATIVAGANDGNSIKGKLPTGSHLLVPVFPPLERTIDVAPSPIDKPQIGATVEVSPDARFSTLARLLNDVEIALDDIDAVRARATASMRTAQNICTNFEALQRSMVNFAEDYINANVFYARNAGVAGRQLTYDEAHEGEAARAAALESVAVATDKVWEKLYGQPVWKKEYHTAEDDLANALGRLKEKMADATMMGIMAAIVPVVFAMPMSVRRARLLRSKRVGMACLNYICHLAARAAVALANSPDKADWDRMRKIAQQQKYAGAECKDIIEYACACTRAFDTSPATRPMSSAPFSCLGIVHTLFAGRALEQTWTQDERTMNRASGAKNAFAIIFDNFSPLLRAAGESGRRDGPSDWWEESLKQKVEAYETAKEAAEAAKTALELTEPLKESDACRFLGALLSPFDKEQGPLRALIPENARSAYVVFQTLWETGTNASKAVEAANKETNASVFSGAANLVDATKGVVEGAKALELFEENAEALEMAEESVAILGRANLVLTVIAEGFEAYEASEEGKTTEAEGHAALAGASLCFLLGSGAATAGASVAGGLVLAVGAVLLVGGVIATKGKLGAEIYRGETVSLFEGIMTSDTPQWASLFDFGNELAQLREAFEAANFDRAAVFLRLEHAGKMAAGPGPLQP